MSVLTIINLFLLPCLITILIAGAILNYKSIEFNVYQKTLMKTFVFWASIMMYVYVKFFCGVHFDQLMTISFVSDVCSLQVLLLGAICFISLISYPVVILDAKYLVLKNWHKRISPIAISIAVYFIAHLVAGVNPFIKYTSMDEFVANIGSLTVILRLALYAMFIVFWAWDLLKIWQVVPCFNRYIQENYADSQCNVGWIRRLVIYIAAVLVAYSVLLFFSSPLVNCIYISFLIVAFSYMVEMSLVHHTSEGLESVNVLRDPKNPKEFIFVPAGGVESVEPILSPVASLESLTNTLAQVDAWMNSEQPYTDVNFTTNNIIDAFPQFTRYDLANLFRSKSITFQSYVRHFRIKRSCEIMRDRDKNEYALKVFSMVGFSHYSSFSRAFVTLLGISPSDFMKLTDSEKSEIVKQLQNY